MNPLAGHFRHGLDPLGLQAGSEVGSPLFDWKCLGEDLVQYCSCNLNIHLSSFINGHFRILKWRYRFHIFLAYFWPKFQGISEHPFKWLIFQRKRLNFPLPCKGSSEENVRMGRPTVCHVPRATQLPWLCTHGRYQRRPTDVTDVTHGFVGQWGFVWKCWVYSQWNSHFS